MTLASKFQDLDRYLTNKVKPLDDYPQDASEAMARPLVLSDNAVLYGQFDQSDVFGYTMTGPDRYTEAGVRLYQTEVGRLMLEAICTQINSQIMETEA